MQALSAGISADEGAPASVYARAAMERRGLSLLRHRARPLSGALLKEASLIVGMTPGHAEWIGKQFPSLSVPVRSFAPPIPDPYGGSRAEYEQTASALETRISALIEELASAP